MAMAPAPPAARRARFFLLATLAALALLLAGLGSTRASAVPAAADFPSADLRDSVPHPGAAAAAGLVHAPVARLLALSASSSSSLVGRHLLEHERPAASPVAHRADDGPAPPRSPAAPAHVTAAPPAGTDDDAPLPVCALFSRTRSGGKVEGVHRVDGRTFVVREYPGASGEGRVFVVRELIGATNGTATDDDDAAVAAPSSESFAAWEPSTYDDSGENNRTGLDGGAHTFVVREYPGASGEGRTFVVRELIGASNGTAADNDDDDDAAAASPSLDLERFAAREASTDDDTGDNNGTGLDGGGGGGGNDFDRVMVQFCTVLGHAVTALDAMTWLSRLRGFLYGILGIH